MFDIGSIFIGWEASLGNNIRRLVNRGSTILHLGPDYLFVELLIRRI